MLGSKSVILKTLTEVRKQELGIYTRLPLMAHYLPTSNSLIALHIPFVNINKSLDGINAYPVNQLNLYFEYNGNYLVENGTYELLYAQGIQYAFKRLTVETAIQTPLIQSNNLPDQRKYSLFIGTRYVF